MEGIFLSINNSVTKSKFSSKIIIRPVKMFNKILIIVVIAAFVEGIPAPEDDSGVPASIPDIPTDSVPSVDPQAGIPVPGGAPGGISQPNK